jgi:ferredoxin
MCAAWEESRMRALIAEDACTACGLCADSCPQVFAMGESCAQVIADPVPSGSETAAREAAEGCPVDAISLED